jgi:diaminopimelate decarboxylase
MFDYCIKTASSFLVRRSQRWQSESELRDLSLWNLTTNKKNHIEVDGLDTVDLVDQYGSPLFVVNQKQLLTDAQNITRALSIAPSGAKVFYSYKTNCIPGILKEVHKQGIGAEVISPYELWLAEQLTVPGNSIVYNGVNKTEESLRRAIEMNILSINIDHWEEIDKIHLLANKLGKNVRVGIRLALMPQNQFGFEIENGEAIEACKKIQSYSKYIRLQCIHFHNTSNALNAASHKTNTLKALRFIKQIKDETNIVISYLNIGGGFGVPTIKIMSRSEYGTYRLFDCLPKPPRLRDYQPIDSTLYEIINSIKIFCQKYNLEAPKILIEPGRFITSRSEFLLTRVHTIKTKKDGTLFAITDAGRLSSTYPCDYEYHEIFVANRANDSMNQVYKIMGRVCTSADWMVKNRYLPNLQPGDILAIMDAGAYFSSYSSNFSFPRPAVVMVIDGKSLLLRKHETFEHLVAMDVIDPIGVG